MRLAIVSDIHGNLLALEAVLKDLAARSVDATVNLGDCATSPLWPRETIELLNSLNWPTVRGNHDRWLVDDADAPATAALSIPYVRAQLSAEQLMHLHALPGTLLVDGSVRAVHGTPASDREYLMEDAVDDRLTAITPTVLQSRLADCTERVVICGHSHQPRTVVTPNGTLVINPGSVGCPRSAEHPRWREVEASGPLARYAIAARARSQWSVELIALTYDWSPVVKRAQENGRTDWALGFQGFV